MAEAKETVDIEVVLLIEELTWTDVYTKHMQIVS